MFEGPHRSSSISSQRDIQFVVVDGERMCKLRATAAHHMVPGASRAFEEPTFLTLAGSFHGAKEQPAHQGLLSDPSGDDNGNAD